MKWAQCRMYAALSTARPEKISPDDVSSDKPAGEELYGAYASSASLRAAESISSDRSEPYSLLNNVDHLCNTRQELNVIIIAAPATVAKMHRGSNRVVQRNVEEGQLRQGESN